MLSRRTLPVRAPSQLISATMWAAGLRFPSGFLPHARLDKFSITGLRDTSRSFAMDRGQTSYGNYFVSVCKRFVTGTEKISLSGMKFNVRCDND